MLSVCLGCWTEGRVQSQESGAYCLGWIEYFKSRKKLEQRKTVKNLLCVAYILFDVNCWVPLPIHNQPKLFRLRLNHFFASTVSASLFSRSCLGKIFLFLFPLKTFHPLACCLRGCGKSFETKARRESVEFLICVSCSFVVDFSSLLCRLAR